MMTHNSEELRQVLDKLVEQYSLQPAKSLWILETSWRTVAGDTVANRTRILGYKPKVLTIAVTSSSWSQQLQFFIPELITKINMELHTDFVQEIRTRVNLRAFRPVTRLRSAGELSMRVGKIRPRTQDLGVLLDHVKHNYEDAAELWLSGDYQSCARCGSPVLKPYELCSICAQDRQPQA
jgi:hypothetical protein